MKPKWRDKSQENHERWLAMALKKNRLTSEPEIINFLTLALCGEVGELANLIKKMWRGDSVATSDIHSELADIRIYLEHLAGHLGCDLDRACHDKIDEVALRLDAMESPASLPQEENRP